MRPACRPNETTGEEADAGEFSGTRHGAVALAAALLAGLGTGASAQTDPAASYPSRTIKIVVGFAAGGGNDIIARIIGQKLQDSLAPIRDHRKQGGRGRTARRRGGDGVAARRLHPPGRRQRRHEHHPRDLGEAALRRAEELRPDLDDRELSAHPRGLPVPPGQERAGTGGVDEGQSGQVELRDIVLRLHAGDRTVQAQDRGARRRRSPTRAATNRW